MFLTLQKQQERVYPVSEDQINFKVEEQLCTQKYLTEKINLRVP